MCENEPQPGRTWVDEIIGLDCARVLRVGCRYNTVFLAVGVVIRRQQDRRSIVRLQSLSFANILKYFVSLLSSRTHFASAVHVVFNHCDIGVYPDTRRAHARPLNLPPVLVPSIPRTIHGLQSIKQA